MEISENWLEDVARERDKEIADALVEFDQYDIQGLPALLQNDILALRKGVEEQVGYIDCLQDEVRGSAHGVTGDESAGYISEERAEDIITFYCRRRWGV